MYYNNHKRINGRNKMSIKRYIPVILLSLSSIVFAADDHKFFEHCKPGKVLEFEKDNQQRGEKTQFEIKYCGTADHSVTVAVKKVTPFFCAYAKGYNENPIYVTFFSIDGITFDAGFVTDTLKFRVVDNDLGTFFCEAVPHWEREIKLRVLNFRSP